MRRTATLPFILLLLAACSTNPVTGKREFNMVSENQELQMGSEGHVGVLREYRVYSEKPELNRLVNDVGQEIARASERPNLPWTFTVLDTPMVNAMALPGGYIYITRGMLERINSRDELAGVLGHEIAHVTARHAAQRISRMQLAQFGMLLGAVVAGPSTYQQYGQFIELGATLLFQRYSRTQETQADLVGTGYLARTGFNPVGAERMLIALQRLSKGETSSIERYFMSHPDPGKRVNDVRKKIAEVGGTYDLPDRGRYVALLDGVITGNSTQHITIKDDTVYDRDHGIILAAPQGWVPTTAPGAFFVMHPKEKANTYFVAQEAEAAELGRTTNAQDAVRQRFQQMGLQYLSSGTVTTRSGERFVIDQWAAQTQQGAVSVETTQFAHGDHVAVLIFVTPSRRRGESPLGAMVERMLVDRNRARAATPPRLKVASSRRGDTWSALAQRATGNTRDAETIANINGFAVNDAVPVGILVKLPEEVPEE
ncbi:MAG TPA: M48 family metalloprotease [Thermoanaerobaculia bacterium]